MGKGLILHSGPLISLELKSTEPLYTQLIFYGNRLCTYFFFLTEQVDICLMGICFNPPMMLQVSLAHFHFFVIKTSLLPKIA